MRFVTFGLGIGLLVSYCTPAEARVYLANEVLAMRGFETLRGKRVGLLTNPSGVDGRGRSVIDILHKTPKVNLDLQPVEDFLEACVGYPIETPGSSELVVTRETLPAETTMIVLDHAR